MFRADKYELNQQLSRRRGTMTKSLPRQWEGQVVTSLLAQIDGPHDQVRRIARLQDLRPIALERVLGSNLCDSQAQEEWAQPSGASPRTLGGPFLRPAGMSLHLCLEQFRATKAIPGWLYGRPTTQPASGLVMKAREHSRRCCGGGMGVAPSRFSFRDFLVKSSARASLFLLSSMICV